MARNILCILVILAGVFLAANGTGEWSKISKKDEDLQPVVTYAISALNRLNPSNSMYKHKVTEIKKARRQLVAGFNYQIIVMTQGTLCRIGEETAEENCELDPNGVTQKCNLVVYVRPWEDSMVLQEEQVRCKPAKVGGGKDKAKDKKKKNKKNKNKKGKNKNGRNGDKKNKKDKKGRSRRDLVEVPLQRMPKYKKGITPIFPYYDEFEEWRVQYNRTYKQHSDEYNLRYEIFEDNMEQVKLLNRYEKGTAKYGATKFADLTKEEFRKFYTGLKEPVEDHKLKPAKIPKGKAPDACDWRTKGAVSEVKNQGMCGSCWAYSTTGNIEGQWKIQKGPLISLSEQELVDCDKIDDGCNGGLPTQAYQEIMRLGGLESEADYPYKGYGEKCEFVKSKVKVNITGAVNISQDEAEIASWLAANGPISIGINANAMQFYFGGISYPFKFLCEPDSLDHGVLIVGYGVEGDKPYWIIKNSWGPSWGEKGYYLVYRGAGVCGLNKMCTSSVVS
ncbi:cathepsin L-like [Amphiura filiformis]|uniref:cathepsin L-like n=1 Tax=Amphiura filiformis TaxID=82378 RepID=UPI003B20BB8D